MCQILKLISIVIVIVVAKGSISNCEDFKLPSVIRPLKYELSLQTNIHDGNLNFSAYVKIHLNASKDSEQIVLHSVNLTLKNISLYNSDSSELILGNLAYSETKNHEIVTIDVLGHLLENMTYVLHIIYTGVLHENFVGYYESAGTSKKLYFASIYFQTTKFRHLCPSFDEMGITSAFEFEITHHDTYHAISNNDKIRHSEASQIDDFVTTKFLSTESLPLSSIAIIVSNFKSSSIGDIQKIEIYGKDEFIDSCFFREALIASFESMKNFHDYFKPSHKLDYLKLVMIPDIISDVSTFELIIFNQYHLIYQSYGITTTQKDKMLRYITRTFAQQFFGNIVSMSTIQDTFITGGFARFYEFLIADMVKPDDHIMDLYSTEVMQKALEIDSFLSTNELVKIEADEINQLASAKFSSLLRMYVKVVGEDKFKENVLSLIATYKFQTITAEIFYEIFNENLSEEFSGFFDVWTTNPGYPVIEITRESSNKINLIQSRFLTFSNETLEHSPWIIPIDYITSNGEKDQVIMNSEEMSIDVPEDEWIIFNVNQNGYYRVNYDYDSWLTLIDILNSLRYSTIPVLNRAAIIDDAFNLVISNKIPYEIYFGILSYLEYEKDLMPWKTASNGLQYIDMMLTNYTELNRNEKFREFVIRIVEPLHNHLGMNLKTGETSFERQLREISMFWMCKMKVKSCLDYVNEKLQEFLKNPLNIHFDMTQIVLCNAMRYAEFETFSILLQSMLNHNGSREIMIKSLACSEDFESIWNYYLNYISFYDSDKISKYDKRLMLIAVMENNKFGVHVGNKFIDIFSMRLEDSEISFMLNAMAKRIWKANRLTEFNSTLILLQTSGIISREMKAAYESIGENNLKWFDENHEEISVWLNEHVTSTTTSTTEYYQSSTTIDETTETTTTDRGAIENNDKLFYIFFIIVQRLFA